MDRKYIGQQVPVAILLGVVLLILAGCGLGLVVGSGNSTTEEREIEGVEGVVLAFAGDLQITQGDEERLVITADDNVMPLITTEVNNGVLTIAGKSTVGVQVMTELRYDLTVRDLSSLRLTGAGNAEMDGLETGDLALAISGAGNLAIRNVDADRIAATLSGVGNIELSGTAARQEIELTGAGNYDGGNLHTGAADVRITGLGSATVWATETLDAAISGAGNIEYFGDPELNQDVSGLGNVSSKGEK